MKLVLYRKAEADLIDIYDYVAAHSAARAETTVAEVLNGLRTLKTFPAAGRVRDELYPGLRSWPVLDYTAFYFVDGTEVGIVRILGGQEITSELFLK